MDQRGMSFAFEPELQYPIPPKPKKRVSTDVLFTSADQQLEKMYEWNARYGFGFSNRDFRAVERSVPTRRSDIHSAVTLVPYIAGRQAVFRTLSALWRLAGAEQVRCTEYGALADHRHVRLYGVQAVSHASGLRWEVLNLDAFRESAPYHMERWRGLPHAGVIAAAAMHPEWVRAMDGKTVPYVWAPGYLVTDPGYEPWAHSLSLHFCPHDGRLRLEVDWHHEGHESWAVPVIERPRIDAAQRWLVRRAPKLFWGFQSHIFPAAA